MTSNQSCLIIGSNSFSGASYSNYLLGQGFRVFGCSRSPEPHPTFLPYRWGGGDENFSFHQLDLNLNLASIMELIHTERIHYVVNFASQSMVAESWANPSHWFATNTLSTVALHDELRKLDFLERYVHISTPEVYGSCEGFVTEDNTFNPSTPYAVSRAAADMSLQSFFEAYDFPVVTTRASNVFGPGQQLYRIIPRTILFILLNKKLKLHGGGASMRSFIHIDDVSRATLDIMLNGTNGDSYHISTDEIITIRSLVEKICHLMDADFDTHIEIVGERLGKDAAYQLDSTKIREQFGWAEAKALDDGIRECIAWVEQNLEILKDEPQSYIHKP